VFGEKGIYDIQSVIIQQNISKNNALPAIFLDKTTPF
jgi:hypothetical protein